jgi:acyl-CoA oxidase
MVSALDIFRSNGFGLVERNKEKGAEQAMRTSQARESEEGGLANPNDVRRSWKTSYPAPASLDILALQRLLDHDNHAMRSELRAFLADPLFQPRYALELSEERELALARLKAICPPVLGGKFLSIWDFIKNPRRIFAAHEIVGMADGSLATKMTVQFNLAGGTILKLGTARHHEMLLDSMDSIERVGCFALTELGYGNNAVRIPYTF